MKIIVCMKQVPAGTKVDIDPETGAMKRMSGDTRTNPYDLFALETAIRLREQVGGTVTVLTMGPPQAETMVRDAYTMGADDAVILSDRKFAGADVLATSYALSQAIQVLGGADLICDALRDDKVVDAPARILFAGMETVAPPAVLDLFRVEQAEAVGEPCRQQLGHLGALLIGKARAHPVGLGVLDVDLGVRHVQVAAEDHRLFRVQSPQIRPEIVLPVHAVVQPL